MARDDHDYDNSDERHSAAAAPTAEEMKHQAERMLQKNQDAIKNFQLSDEDLASIVPGVKVPTQMRPWVQMGLDWLKYYALGKTDQLFTGATKLAFAVGIKNRKAQQIIGATAETGARVGIITFQQLLAGFRASRELATERQENSHRFEAIREATGADQNNNQMIALAEQRAQTHWWGKIKWIGTDAPMLITLLIKGWSDQRRSFDKWKNFKGITPADAEAATHLRSETDRLMEELKPELARAKSETERHLKIQKEVEGLIKTERTKYVNENFSQERYLEVAAEKDKQHAEWYGHERYRYSKEEFKKEIAKEFDESIGNQVRSTLNKRLNGEDTPEDKKDTNWLSHAGYAGIAGTQILQATLGGKPAKDTATHAPEMIGHLTEEMKTYCESRYGDCTFPSPGDIQITGIGHDQGTMSLKDYVIGVFQAHERDLKPNVKWEKHDKDGRVIGVIDPLAEPLVKKLEPAVEVIADAISKGLSPEALVALVGGNEVIRHGPNGARSFAPVEQVKAAIEKLKGPLGMRDSVTAEEFLGKFEKPADITAAVEGNLKTLSGKPKGYFAGLLSDNVLEQAKMKKADIKELHKEVPADMADFLAANAMYLDGKGEEYLKKIGVGEKDRQAITDFAEKLKSGDKEALDYATSPASPVRGAIAAAGLLAQTKGGEKNYWAGRTDPKEIARVHQEIEAARQKAPETAAGEEMEHPQRERGELSEKDSTESRAGERDEPADDWRTRARKTNPSRNAEAQEENATPEWDAEKSDPDNKRQGHNGTSEHPVSVDGWSGREHSKHGKLQKVAKYIDNFIGPNTHNSPKAGKRL